MRKKSKNLLWQITLDDYIIIVERAISNGVQSGENMQKYFVEYMKEKNIQPIAETNKDIDMVAGEFRSKKYKVLNMQEIERRRKNNEQ